MDRLISNSVQGNHMVTESETIVKDTQSRKYQLTINNPLDAEYEEVKGSDIMIKCPFTHEEIKKRLANLTSIDYWCFADEIGLQGETPHTHIYFVSHAPIRFSTVKKQFPTAHIETAYGTSQSNRDYILKEGKWKDTKKQETSIEGSFEEGGEIPANERMGQNGELQFIYSMIEGGLSTAEILKLYPESMRYLDKIDRTRQIMIEDEYKDTWRDLEVTYIYGETNTGKTRTVMEECGYSRTFRVTDYGHPFDGYKNQSVLLFEEFNSSLRIQDMLVYLDGYPCELPARYNNKQACYLKVYITTNIKLEKQYPNVQIENPEIWKAFLRRINKVQIYNKDGTIFYYDSVKEYLNRDTTFHPITKEEEKDLPFKD